MRCVAKKCLQYTDSIGPIGWSNCRCVSCRLPRKTLGLSSFEIASSKSAILCFVLSFFTLQRTPDGLIKQIIFFALRCVCCVCCACHEVACPHCSLYCLWFVYLLATCCPFSHVPLCAPAFRRTNVHKNIDTHTYLHVYMIV